MTAHGELYIDEECRDYFRQELDSVFGENNWRLDGSKFGDYWTMSSFPEVVEVDIYDDEQEIVIGTAVITSEPHIETDGYDRWVEMEPKSIKIEKKEK